LIKLGRLVTPTAMDEIRAGKDGDAFYMRGGLKLLHPDGVPLVCDHDMTREVGTVHELFEADDIDGGNVRPWLWARATVTDAPAWLKRGTRCSFGFVQVHRNADFGWTHNAIVEEVSLLSSECTPFEPLAHVALLRAVPTDGEVIHGGPIIRRPIGQILRVR
jgi:hypothetical protein